MTSRLSFLFLILNSYLFAIPVLITTAPLKYEEKVDKSKLILKEVDSVSRFCEPLTLVDVENNEYITTHHINKNVIVCQKDVKLVEDNEVVFNFGGLKIVKKGKIIYENSEFIRFRNLDGTIEQIYKDGRSK
ncbi:MULTISPECIES: hypothetical protein [Arcobacteraceae]|uniref:hypothetical protein n=1 Tax=Arcobacteraceae TaxID=2808963 RepID=UPI000DEAF5AF|nr:MULTISPECIES: hypothetical protein [Arcobacteraceae]MBL3519862.1 hypothetical protein [Aliarcobacter lanthieri]RBQ25963.1 hypothetical protein CRU88_09720 [Arcobacter sp. CECT 9188]